MYGTDSETGGKKYLPDWWKLVQALFLPAELKMTTLTILSEIDVIL